MTASDLTGIIYDLRDLVLLVERKAELLTGLRKNGQEFPVEISLGEVTQNGQRVFTGFIRDISERKQAEEMREPLPGNEFETPAAFGLWPHWHKTEVL